MAAFLLPFPKFRALDSNGDPLAGGKLYSYAAGTSTPQVTYTDQGGGTPNANPVVLDANGEANVWMSASSYKFVLKDASDVTQWTIDNVSAQVLTAQIVDGILSADSTGRAKMAAGFFGVNATSLAHFADGFFTATAAAIAKFADGFLSADSTGRAKMADGFLTQAKLAARATGTSVAAGGVAISGSSGSYSMTSSTYADVTNLSVTITTTGRPVKVFLQPDGSGSGNINATCTAAPGVAALYLQLLRDSTSVGIFVMSSNVQTDTGGLADVGGFPGQFLFVDTPAAGTYVYKVQCKVGAAPSSTGFVSSAKLVAYEI